MRTTRNFPRFKAIKSQYLYFYKYEIQKIRAVINFIVKLLRPVRQHLKQ